MTTIESHRAGRPRGDEARRMAEERGPADATLLRQLAQLCRHEADYGSMTHGHVIAERLNMLANAVEMEAEQ